MNKYLTPLAIVASFSTLAFITGCSSSDSNTASVPPNAVVIDDTNAVGIVLGVTQTSAEPVEVLEVIGVETTRVPNLYKALDIIKPLLTNISTVNASTSVDISRELPCANNNGDGTISGSEITAEDGTTTTSGSASFSNCTFISDFESITIDGNLSFSFSDNLSDDYTSSVSGSITMSILVNNDSSLGDVSDNGFTANSFSGNGTFTFSGFVFSETGNNFDNTYNIDQLTYAIDFVIDGTQGGGYLVTLNAPLTESGVNPISDCHGSGHIIITGANGTTAEGIFNNDDTVTIKANGEIIQSAFSYCNFF